MKVAIIGSRGIANLDIKNYIAGQALYNITEIVSGGAEGVDKIAKSYALENSIKYTEILPDYKHFGKAAPILRNKLIVETSDFILAFWDSTSKGTLYTINYCKKTSTPHAVIIIS